MKYCPECASKLDTKLIDGVERKACSASGCGFVHWDNPLPVVAALVQYQGQIVLARNVKWPAGIFSLVTGFLERREAPEQAVLREVKEELGLNCEISDFIGHYPFTEMNQIIMAFVVDAVGTLKTSEEIAEIKLIPVEQLGAYNFGRLYITVSVVKDWLKKRAPSP